jgi:hypothetical protein
MAASEFVSKAAFCFNAQLRQFNYALIGDLKRRAEIPEPAAKRTRELDPVC